MVELLATASGAEVKCGARMRRCDTRPAHASSRLVRADETRVFVSSRALPILSLAATADASPLALTALTLSLIHI